MITTVGLHEGINESLYKALEKSRHESCYGMTIFAYCLDGTEEDDDHTLQM